MTVHNAGPDDAGTTNPDDKPVRVFGSTIVYSAELGPPLEIVGVLSGDCWVDRYTEVLPSGDWIIEFDYFFDPIAAGASRTCTSDIYFSTQAPAQLATNWRVTSANDREIDSSNNRVDYTFVSASAASPISVPSGSPSVWLALTLGLLLIAGNVMQRRHARR